MHRFDDPAYAALTLRLRNVDTVADATLVADELLAHGHIRTVADEDAARDVMTDAWFAAAERREYIALVTATNHDAEQINNAIQARRLENGMINEHAAAIGRDGQRLLVGDVVQTRRNDATNGVQNRATWCITRINDHHLELERVDDTTDRRKITRDYAADHTHLAYATTVHGVQGETSDTAMIGPGVGAAGLYVGLTRGRRHNQALVVASGASQTRARIVEALHRGVPNSRSRTAESPRPSTSGTQHAPRRLSAAATRTESAQRQAASVDDPRADTACSVGERIANPHNYASSFRGIFSFSSPRRSCDIPRLDTPSRGPAVGRITQRIG